jgi:hypothetical protein
MRKCRTWKIGEQKRGEDNDTGRESKEEGQRTEGKNSGEKQKRDRFVWS